MKEEIDDIDEILKIVIEKVEEDKTIKDFRKDYPDEFEKLEKASLIYISEIDLKIVKTEFPDNRLEYLITKLAYLYEYFYSLDDYQKLVNNLKKKDLFSKLKNKCPDDEETERTKQFIKPFDIENGEKLTQLFFKSYVLMLICLRRS